MPRPKPTIRTTAMPVSKPKPNKIVVVAPTPADKVRLEWAQFETWIAAQRKDASVTRESELSAAKQQMETKKRSLPKGFHATLMKDYEDGRQKIIRASERLLVDRFRVEWEERLEKAGLNVEDWDPMTPVEQEAVRSALEGPSDEEEDHTASHDIEIWQHLSHVPPVPPVSHPKPHSAIPDLASWSTEADRLRGLSPLPDLPDWNRPYTPHPAQQPAAAPYAAPAPREAKQNGARYTGPVLVEDKPTESLEDAEFREFKMSIREQMIREFHEEAVELEIALVRQEHAANLESSAVKALLACHEVDMEELRQQKEDKRKAIVDAERTKRKAEIRRRALQSKVPALHQPTARMALVEKPPLQKAQSSGWGSVRDVVEPRKETPPPALPRPSSRMTMADRPSLLKGPISGWGSVLDEFESANEISSHAFSGKPRPQSPPVVVVVEAPDPPPVIDSPAAGKATASRGKKSKPLKKGAVQATVMPTKKEEVPPPVQPAADKIDPRPTWQGKDKSRGGLKPSSPPKATVEEVSDEDENSKVWARRDAPPNEVDELAALFFKEASGQLAPPINDGLNRGPAQVTRPKGVPESKKKPIPPPTQQWSETSDAPSSAVGEGTSDYWGRTTSSGAESTSDENHTVWKPPVASLDSEDEEDGSDDGGFLQSLAGGLVEPMENRPTTPWGKTIRQAPSVGGGGGSVLRNIATNHSQPKYEPRWGGSRVDVKPVHPQNSRGVAHDDWESQMMGKFLGFSQGSGR